MKKSTLNLIINILMFLCMSAIAGIGFLIKFTLIPGQERWLKYERNVELYFFGMDRHEWGTIHLVIGFILLGLLVLHIIFHWHVITCVCCRFIQRKTVRNISALLFLTISALLIFIPFLIKPNIVEIEKGKGRQISNNSISINKESNSIPSHPKNHADNKTAFERHEHINPSIEVKGYMTLAEVSKKYNVASEFIKIKLNIPNSISDNQKLGGLRNKYDFTMHDVETIINAYQEKKK